MMLLAEEWLAVVKQATISMDYFGIIVIETDRPDDLDIALTLLTADNSGVHAKRGDSIAMLGPGTIGCLLADCFDTGTRAMAYAMQRKYQQAGAAAWCGAASNPRSDVGGMLALATADAHLSAALAAGVP